LSLTLSLCLRRMRRELGGYWPWQGAWCLCDIVPGPLSLMQAGERRGEDIEKSSEYLNSGL
jgi:hypothetical protein